MKTFYFLFLIAIASCNPSGFKGLSRGIKKDCFDNKAAVKNLDHHNRMKLFHDGKLSFLNLQSDTFFVMAKTRNQTGQRVYRIWNERGESNYSYTHPNLQTDESIQFSPRVTELIANWDTLTLRKEEANRPRTFHELTVQAVRVIVNEGKWQLSCLHFTEF
ncbi:hypothetical protein WJU16_03040 [Chitinophaga pollutisoli]|uniref:Uncharacterized protein n=1 Tax=Chitinophaga pollutisoli TaxID=3133966 RepID=A0ABZ2YSU3_9BACT